MRIIPLHAVAPAERDTLCRRFHEEVAQAAFPMAAELEAADAWIKRMAHPSASALEPTLHMHLALDDAGGDKRKSVIAGGLLVEIYRVSRAVLFTYIAVAPAYRRRGLGRRLLEGAETALAEAGYGDCPILAEAEDPVRVGQEAHSANLDLGLRLRILAALGFARLDFGYVQPALSPEKRPVHWLFLLALRRSLDEGTLPVPRLTAFLDEFFACLDNHPDNAHHLEAMKNQLANLKVVTLTPLA